MQVELIEQDIRNRELALKRCKYNLSCLQCIDDPVYVDAAKLLSQEIFYLQDQLTRYNTLLNLLREEQPVYDEPLPRV